jgi:hypothetical protein
LRETLDGVDPEQLRPVFKELFRVAQRGKVLEKFLFRGKYYILSIDGTGYFSSQKIHCPCCLKKVNKATGEITYSHQMLMASIVHPDMNTVIPLAPEPIGNADGDVKNDCERNAAKRLLEKIRAEHPKLPFLVVEDGLASNGPHIEELIKHDMEFLLGVKPGDHPFLFQKVEEAINADRAPCVRGKTDEGRDCEAMFVLDVPLNAANSHLKVNFLQYQEFDENGKEVKRFTWVTRLPLTKDFTFPASAAGRSRWKIENENNNTLKNHGYNLEHNYGHGDLHLSFVFATLIVLAFLIDQLLLICCAAFKASLKTCGTKRELWQRIRVHFRTYALNCIGQLHQFIASLTGKLRLPELVDTA